jgi:hypothetical protein
VYLLQQARGSRKDAASVLLVPYQVSAHATRCLGSHCLLLPAALLAGDRFRHY